MSGAAWVQGLMGGALAFDGVDDAVNVPHVAALDGYPLTAAAWFRTSAASGVKGIVNKYSVGSYNGYQVFMDSGRLCAWYIRDQANHVYDGSDCTFAVGGFADGQWHQVVFVVDAGGGRLYVDGTLKGTQAWTGSAGAVTTTQALRLGDYPGVAGGGHFLGDVDQVRLYGGALTAAQVASLYDSDAGVDLIFADGFESGSFGAWSASAVDGGDLHVSAGAALASTTAGAEGLVDDQAALWVQDSRPADESRYRARFYVDPSDFDPGEDSASFRTRIFLAFDEAPQRRLVAIVVRRMSGQYALMGTTRLDDGTQVDAGFFPITGRAPRGRVRAGAGRARPARITARSGCGSTASCSRPSATWTTTRAASISSGWARQPQGGRFRHDQVGRVRVAAREVHRPAALASSTADPPGLSGCLRWVRL